MSASERGWGPFEAIRGLRPSGTLPQVTPIRRILSDLPTSADPYADARAALEPLRGRIVPDARIDLRLESIPWAIKELGSQEGRQQMTSFQRFRAGRAADPP